jgi:hypothetical protein
MDNKEKVSAIGQLAIDVGALQHKIEIAENHGIPVDQDDRVELKLRTDIIRMLTKPHCQIWNIKPLTNATSSQFHSV